MERILVMNNSKTYDVLKEYLLVLGYELIQEENHMLGLEMVIQEQVSLIIIDILYQNISGIQLCKEIRKSSDIPIIIITEHDNEIYKINAFFNGVDDYIVAPFSVQETIARILAHAERFKRYRSSEAKKKQLSFSSIHIDFDSRRVVKDKKELVLTNREFNLLHLFMKNPDVVLSKERIYNALWESSEFGDIGIVAVYIKKLRDKIECDVSQPKIIETVKWVGYRFNKI